MLIITVENSKKYINNNWRTGMNFWMKRLFSYLVHPLSFSHTLFSYSISLSLTHTLSFFIPLPTSSSLYLLLSRPSLQWRRHLWSFEPGHEAGSFVPEHYFAKKCFPNPQAFPYRVMHQEWRTYFGDTLVVWSISF